mmetsp:Transcript_2264/g.5372  ORF Transcript_2264/g.5372 Transcript_2264/m.5372 type:complete len:221 (+) Transcript_2264:823-1485(+)
MGPDPVVGAGTSIAIGDSRFGSISRVEKLHVIDPSIIVGIVVFPWKALFVHLVQDVVKGFSQVGFPIPILGHSRSLVGIIGLGVVRDLPINHVRREGDRVIRLAFGVVLDTARRNNSIVHTQTIPQPIDFIAGDPIHAVFLALPGYQNDKCFELKWLLGLGFGIEGPKARFVVASNNTRPCLFGHAGKTIVDFLTLFGIQIPTHLVVIRNILGHSPRRHH